MLVRVFVAAAFVVSGATVLLQVTGATPAGAADVAPTVTTQPISQYYATGQSLTFTAAASGSPTPTVQWQYSFNGGTTWANLSGATSPTLTIGPLNGFVNGWELQAVFTNSIGSATSNPATMTLSTTAPVLTTQPISQYYATGQSPTFTAAASGSPTPNVQWQYSFNGGTTWANLSGATSPTLTIGPLNGFVNGWELQAVFTNSVSSATSNPATMTLGAAPVVTAQPTEFYFMLDGNDDIGFTAAASGSPTPNVQWQVSLPGVYPWTNISGATSVPYGYIPIDGFYDSQWSVRAVFTNPLGSATTNAALTGGYPPGDPL
jgi:hypothetical protein